jgi:hypothetical protein
VFDSRVRESLKHKITSAFKERRFDQGLLDGIAFLDQVATDRPLAKELPAGQPRQGSFLMTALIIGAVVLLVLFFFRLISGAGRAGSGGVGSPGGGGFLSSLFGAMGGVFLGNWLYNTFWGDQAHASESGHFTGDTHDAGGHEYESTSSDWDSGGDAGGDMGGFDSGDFGGDAGGGDW